MKEEQGRRTAMSLPHWGHSDVVGLVTLCTPQSLLYRGISSVDLLSHPSGVLCIHILIQLQGRPCRVRSHSGLRGCEAALTNTAMVDTPRK